jgi:hypothetical protein
MCESKTDRPAFDDSVRAEMIEGVSATLAAYYDAVSPEMVAKEIVDFIEEKAARRDGTRHPLAHQRAPTSYVFPFRWLALAAQRIGRMRSRAFY